MSLQVNLHSHSEGSFLDGLSRVDQMARRAAELGHEYAALTDHGDCNQHLAFTKACQAEGVRPILGMEGYWLSAQRLATARAEKRYPDPSHICLLAMTNQGLSNLWALSSEAYTEKYFYRKPNATPELLRTYAEGIYASDGCAFTELADAVEAGAEDRARQWLGTLQHIFGERFYMELHTWQYLTPRDDDKIKWAGQIITSRQANAKMTALNQAKVRLATELSVPLVVVNDSHHCTPEQWYNKELIWQFNTNANPDQVGEPVQKADHFMADDELYLYMARHGIAEHIVAAAIKNSHDIASHCRVEITPTLSIPRLGRSEADDLVTLLKFCQEGFARYVTDQGRDEALYFARLEEELRLIAAKHFAGYFLLVRDYVLAYKSGSWSQFVRNNPRTPKVPLLVGPGRGSVGGSLVAYLIGIDIIDPLKYGTLFSRFLSPGRKGLPDIDVDVPRSERPDALSYLSKRFNPANVCAIGTLSRNGPKQTLRDLGRALHIDFGDINAMSAHIEEVERLKDPNNPDEDELTYVELIERKGHELKPWAEKSPKHARLFEKLDELSGLVRHSSVHASGVLVSSEPLLGRIPLRTRNPEEGGRGKKRIVTTQFDMWEVEFLGGVKVDVLGIRHLDTLSHARRLIYERHGTWIDYDRSGLSVPEGCINVFVFEDDHFVDPAIWAQIDKGQTLGVFQVETSNCTSTAVEFHPRSEVDVADLTSIIRPGVADAGLKEVYLRRRAGDEPVLYDHPLMERIVGPKWATDTYGVLVYQEQLMECVSTLAGFTPDEADDLRNAVGKKQMDKLLALKQKFVEGCEANPDFMQYFGGGRGEAIVEAKPTRSPPPRPLHLARDAISKIWASIEAAGRYAFNWSHAVGYAIIATWEIWTKHYFPQEFLVALMATDSGNINRYIREARRRNIPVLPPDINQSDRKFTIEGEAIRYGLDTVRGVGVASCRDILAHRPYHSLADYLRRAGQGTDLTVVHHLILIGAFDGFGDRTELLRELQSYRAQADLAQSTLDNVSRLQTVLTRRLAKDKYAITIPDFADPKEMYRIEKELVGTYVTVDPLERFVPTLDACALRDPVDMMRYARGQSFIVGGQITDVTKTVTKKGRTPGAEMAMITVSWNEADFRIVVFPDAWADCKYSLREGLAVACEVTKLDSGCCLKSVVQLEALFGREGIA